MHQILFSGYFRGPPSRVLLGYIRGTNALLHGGPSHPLVQVALLLSVTRPSAQQPSHSVGKTSTIVLFRLQRQKQASDRLATLPVLHVCLHTEQWLPTSQAARTIEKGVGLGIS